MTEQFDPAYGVAEELSPGLRRIVAPNPSPMTFKGTNTYLLGTRDLAVIDPGPERAAHLQAILDAVSDKGGCHNCHSMGSCTAYCPNDLDPMSAIAGLKRETAKSFFKWGR